MKSLHDIKSFGELKRSGYRSVPIKEEMRRNLILKMKNGNRVFEGIYGYDHSVIPQLERAILAGHNINFLGLRGQAKTRMARLLVQLLDEYIPVLKGFDIYEDPFNPLTQTAKDFLQEHGDDAEIEWIHRDNRYTEKLATPDVNIADLIGDLDPIKAAKHQLSFTEEAALHFGLIPRTHRGIFVINELPDLAPRIQVSLFNILQEGDIQIRGHKFRFPIDIFFVFTANPEDYTSRGAIITPLKDRIQSQIYTHYPEDLETAMKITRQEVKISEQKGLQILIPPMIEEIIERISLEARTSEFVDEKSGVSARLSISAYETIHAAVEQRALKNAENISSARITDVFAAIPAIVGKLELTYEGEQLGATAVAIKIIGEALRNFAPKYFKGIELLKRKTNTDAKRKYHDIVQWFESGAMVELRNDDSDHVFHKKLDAFTAADEYLKSKSENPYLLKEIILFTLSEYGLVDKKMVEGNYLFQDQLYSALKGISE